MTAPRERSVGDMLREMDAGATKGPWWWDEVPLPGISKRALAVVLKTHGAGSYILRHEASKPGCEWEPTQGDMALILSLRNALPAIARVLDAADAMRGVAANDWPGWQRACDAYDAARRDAIAALGREA